MVKPTEKDALKLSNDTKEWGVENGIYPYKNYHHLNRLLMREAGKK